MAEPAPAKINLALHVAGRRADGYHLLESLVVFTRFGDRVAASFADRDELAVDGPFAEAVPAEAGNLVLKARDALRLRHSLAMSPPPLAPPHEGEEGSETLTPPSLSWGGARGGGQGKVAIRLTKRLPVASGVGGGSADAAAALRALGRLWNIPPDALGDVAAPLGADVPMCLASVPLIARGIGETIETVSGFPRLPLVLVNPGVPVSTAAVFSRLVSRENPPLPPLPPARTPVELAAWLAIARNDLQAPALGLAPAIGEAADALFANGALVARMSGSGATCFGLFGTRGAADRAATTIAAARPGWFVVSTASFASGEPIDAD